MTKPIIIVSGYHDLTVDISAGVSRYSRRGAEWRIEILAESGRSSWDWVAERWAGVIGVGQSDDMAIFLRRRGTPFVSVLPDLSALGVPSVLMDDAGIGVMAADYLLRSGYRAVGYYGVDLAWSRQRFEGIRGRLTRQRIELFSNALCSDMTRWPGWDVSRSTRAVDAFLKRLPRPAAVVAYNDTMASLIIDRCSELDIEVPVEIAVLGVDNAESACESGPVAISSIDPGTERAGYEAARMLHVVMLGRKPSMVTTVPPRAVVERESTAVSVHRDQIVAEAMRYIMNNALEGASVEGLCAAMNTSRRLVERRFKAAVGCSPGEEIRRVRMNRARELLAETNLSVANIALRCGSRRLSNFCTGFHRDVGMSPTEYRRQHGR